MHITKTVRISERTNQRLAELAAQLESDQSPLIDRLLSRALDPLIAGNGQLHAVQCAMRSFLA